jgi:hypothetical protein
MVFAENYGEAVGGVAVVSLKEAARSRAIGRYIA